MRSQTELEQYIASARAKGTPDDETRRKLLGVGWDDSMVSAALSEGAHEGVPLPPGEKGQKLAGSLSMWDAFEHILMFISLLVLAVVFGQTLHIFIDKWVPNVASGDYGDLLRSFHLILLRWYLATLIVVYPLFAFLFLHIYRRTQQNLEIRGLKSRKVLIYLTLTVTFLIMLWKVVNTIFNLLSGNLTSNFTLHLLVTVGISALIFGYYLQQVREDRAAYV